MSAALVPLFAAALPAQAGDREAREWLERMSDTLVNRNYEGRFFHLRQARSETMRIIHRVDKGKVTERLVSLDGGGREVIRNETEVTFYLPDRRQVIVEKRADDGSLIALPSYSERLEDHYSIERGPATRAFGRRTQIILVQPRDQFRYGYRLWLDQETAMPLQSQLFDRSGNVIEQILFAEVNFRDRISPDSVKPAVSTEGFAMIRQDPQRTVGMQAMRPGWNVRPPPGFRLTTWRLQAIAGSSTPARHLVYSDGLASVSLFIEPRNPRAEPINGLSKVGAAFVFSRNLDDVQLVVVGEVPPKTLEVIADGVTREVAATTPAPSRDAATAPNRPDR
jgi:sigma-E factor negative regulatory protein RseB